MHDKKYVLMTKRVGSTTFRVKVHFKDEGNQTMEDKLLKIFSKNLLANKKKCATIETPQMSRSAGEELS